MERGIIVGNAPRRLVEIEGDDRQLAAEPLVVADRIMALGEGQQGVSLAAASLDGHADVAGSGHDEPIGHGLAPGVQYLSPVSWFEMRSPASVSPDRHPGHRLA